MLMLPVELDIRVLDELERLFGYLHLEAPRSVEQELQELAAGGGESAKAASVGLDVLEHHVRIVATESTTADDAVLERARTAPDRVVGTADRALIERVLEAGIPVVGPRERQRLTLHQPTD